MELFDFLNAVTEKKEELDFELEDINKDYHPRLINKWISMCEPFIPTVNSINKYTDSIPKYIHYKFFLLTIPRRKQYFNFIKKPSQEITDIKRYIARYFDIGLKEVNKYIEILSAEQINKIMEKFRCGINGSQIMEN